MHAPQRAAGYDLLDFAVVLAVTVLMADHRLHAAGRQQLSHLETFDGGEAPHGFSNAIRRAPPSMPARTHLAAQVRKGAEAEYRA